MSDANINIWHDDDGFWVQIGPTTLGPFETEAEAESGSEGRSVNTTTALTFHHQDDVLTLWPQGELNVDDVIYVIGWCPELQNNIVVHPDNIVDENANADVPA